MTAFPFVPRFVGRRRNDMSQRTNRLLAICFAFAGASLAVASHRAVSTRSAVEVVVESAELHPFTHIAFIPEGADPSSIKFKSVKAVIVSTKRTFVKDKLYCEEGYQEPGGSEYCPYIQDGSPMPAYQVSYSYSGPPMASDEYGSTHFSFSVYFHPDELVRRCAFARISAGKISRKDAGCVPYDRHL